MAIISTPTTAGLALEATNRANGDPTDITGVEVGEGHVTTLALAMARAALVTPFSPVRQTPNPAGVSSGSALQYAYVDSTLAVNYDINEAGLYAGSTMVAYVCDDAGAAIGTKPNNASGILPILVAWAGATSIAFSGTFAVVAQGTEDTAGVWEAADAIEAADDTNNSRVMTPLRTAVRLAAAIASGFSGLSFSDIPGVLPINKGGTNSSNAASARTSLGVRSINSTVPINRGGTGAINESGARANLGVRSAADTVPVNRGGTGADDAATARTNLGVVGAADTVLVEVHTTQTSYDNAADNDNTVHFLAV